MDWIRPWWQQKDHYHWLSTYLAAHDLQRFTRHMMGTVVLALAAVPMLILFSTTRPEGVAFHVLAFAVTAACLGMALMWFTRWPTRRQSFVFAMVSNVCIAVICVAQSYPGSGIQSCAVFAALAGYVAFFHSSRLLAVTLGITAVTAVACTLRHGFLSDPALATSKLVVLCVTVLAVPFSAQVLVRILGVDAVNSHLDPLTQLPNRRGFHRSVNALLAVSYRQAPVQFAVVMVDLDDFKRVNDTSGHAAGDRILVAVGDILRQARRADSVIARIGGEEFVVAAVGNEQQAIGLAERVRRDIARLSDGVTASVGVASAPVGRLNEAAMRPFAEGVLEVADQAMYRAKRAGGNRVHVNGRNDYGYAKPSPTIKSTTATNGKSPWITADRAFSGAEISSTTAAASIEPTPARTSAAPTAVPAHLIHATPTPVTTAKKRL